MHNFLKEVKKFCFYFCEECCMKMFDLKTKMSGRFHKFILIIQTTVQKKTCCKNGFEGEMDPMLLLDVVTITTIIIPVIITL